MMTSSENEISEANRVDIPYCQLDSDVLRALIEEFVTRDGTDWDQSGCSLEDKVDQIMAQLADGRVKIVHDLNSESTNLLSTL